WFAVDFDIDDYTNWPFASLGGTDPIDGGRWATSAGDDGSAFVAGENRLLSIATPDGEFVSYTPARPSPALATNVVLAGSSTWKPCEELPSLSPSPLAGIACGTNAAGAPAFFAITAQGWTELSFPDGCAPPASGDLVPWRATFDFSRSQPRVAYAIGGSTLASANDASVTDFPVAAPRRTVSRVSWSGTTLVDNFLGYYFAKDGKPNFLLYLQ
ncbi:MAG: hypothetical protein IJP66_03270, partial [Kiritimatiellae bacterium]|nr:hypothetical protein [Kiritimatiellia bacterium]